MTGWLRQFFSPRSGLIHPQWVAGQYVTYFLERDDGSWVAISLRLKGKSHDRAWVLCADIKTRRGEGAAWFRCDPNAAPSQLDMTMFRYDSIRGLPPDPNDPTTIFDDPRGAIPMVMNLFSVRRLPAAVKTLQNPAREVNYPGEIRQAHLLITQGPGYQKHYDINPNVMVTGVACLSIDGRKHPLIATSFGFNSQEIQEESTFADFVDFSNSRQVDHGHFVLSYPATWSLRSQAANADNGKEACFAHMGGISCSAILGVEIHNGDEVALSKLRLSMIAHLKKGTSTPAGMLNARVADAQQVPENQDRWVFDKSGDEIDGIACCALFLNKERNQLAFVNAYGCILKQNPGRDSTLATMERVFGEILDSFSFT